MTCFGFTLIELLTVIAIISILIAILVPVFNNAKEKGWQSHCTNRLKQVFLVLQMYFQDWEEYPPQTDEIPPTIDAQSVSSYIKSNMHQCPKYPNPFYKYQKPLFPDLLSSNFPVNECQNHPYPLVLHLGGHITISK